MADDAIALAAAVDFIAEKEIEETEDQELEDGVVNNVVNWRLALCESGEFWKVFLTLEKIYLMHRHLDAITFKAKKFGALNQGFEVPSLGLKKFITLTFGPGTCVGPGASTQLNSLLSAHLATLVIIERWGIPLHMTNFKHSNIVARTHVDHLVDLDRMSKELGDDMAGYEPESFPACFLKLHGAWLPEEERDNVKALVYRTGKIVITGIRKDEDVEKCIAQTKAIVSHFPLDNVRASLSSGMYYSENRRSIQAGENMKEIERILGDMREERDATREVPQLMDVEPLPVIEYNPEK